MHALAKTNCAVGASANGFDRDRSIQIAGDEQRSPEPEARASDNEWLDSNEDNDLDTGEAGRAAADLAGWKQHNGRRWPTPSPPRKQAETDATRLLAAATPLA